MKEHHAKARERLAPVSALEIIASTDTSWIQHVLKRSETIHKQKLSFAGRKRKGEIFLAVLKHVKH